MVNGVGGNNNDIPKITSGSNGAQGAGKTEADNTAEINRKIQQYFATAANTETQDNKVNTNKENNFFKNMINTVRNQFPEASAIIDKIVEGLTGGNKAEQTQPAQPTGTPEDVKGATFEPVYDDGPKFDENGNLISDVITNSDGSKDITFGDETVHVSQNGDSITVKDESGKNVALERTPDGGYKFTDEDGHEHSFDKDMNPID